MRYELSDSEWATIKPLLPNKSRGVRRVNDRRVLNGIFWVLRSGAPWRDLPRKLDFGRGPTFRAVKSAAVAVRAMSVVQIVTRRRAVGSPVCHRHPARRAQLPPFCHHAFRGLRHVRSELRTKPHRIRRASLARLWAALSGSVCDPHCAHSNQ